MPLSSRLLPLPVRWSPSVGVLSFVAGAALVVCSHDAFSQTSGGGKPIVTLSVSVSLPQAAPSGPGAPTTPGPATGTRAGTTTDVKIRVPSTGDTMAFTIFEPTSFTDGSKYPLVLHGHGFGGSRTKSSAPSPLPNPTAFMADASIQSLRDAGYGIVSIDQRGHGDSTGSVRVMDPDFEGKDLLAVLDWLEANLGWLAYGPSADGTDRNNLILGSMGGSYGGMYQLLLSHIDPKKRLDAMVVEIAPHHLPYSLAPGTVPKSIWDIALFTLGSAAGKNTGNTFDPFVIQNFPISLAQNHLTPGLEDFFAYHSTSYWCNGQSVATNGGVGTRPLLAPRQAPKVNALVVQGMRDTLFNFNEGYLNYSCLKRSGGDVRLLSTQTGHNSIPIVPDRGALTAQDPQDILKNQCGRIQTAAARKSFFDEHLKGIRGAANDVPRQVCISLSGTDAALVDDVTTGKNGTRFDVPTTTVVSGLLGRPAVVKLGPVTPRAGDLVAGIPHLTVDIGTPVPFVGGEPIVFAALGVVRAGTGLVDPLDNQILPLRGLGKFDVPLPGVGERLKAGDQLALLFYGAHEQFFAGSSLNLNVRQATLLPVKVTGSVWVPRLDVNTPAP